MKRILIPLSLLLSLIPQLAHADFESDLSANQTHSSVSALRELHARAVAGDANSQLNMGGIYFKGEEVKQDYLEAVKWFRMAARQGQAQAQFNIGMMYANGQGVKLDYTEAVSWFRLAALQSLAVAQLNLGVAYTNGQGVPQNAIEAVKLFRLAAAQSDAQAQFNMGVMYATGQGVQQDLIEAYRWAKLAADQGHELALSMMDDLSKRMTPEQNRMALSEKTAPAQPVVRDDLQAGLNACHTGDYATCIKLLVPIANKGNTTALLRLGEMSEKAQGVPHSDKRATARYRQAADLGNAEAQYRLAENYHLGRGVKKDQKIADAWYKKSAAQGYTLSKTKPADIDATATVQKDAAATLNTTNATVTNKSEPDVQATEIKPATLSHNDLQAGLDACQKSDYATCIKLLVPLANKGNTAALLRLGEMSEKAQGVPHNDERATARYRRAAELGNAEAQYRLARNYELGRGVKQDKKQADIWYKKSALQGNQPLKSADDANLTQKTANGKSYEQEKNQLPVPIKKDTDAFPGAEEHKVQQAQVALQAAEARILKTEQTLRDAEARAQQAEQTANQNKTESQSLSARLIQQEADNKALLAAGDSKVQQAALALNAAKAAIQKSEQARTEAEARAQHAEQAASQSKAGSESLAAKLIQQQADTRAQLLAAENKLNQAEQALKTAEARVQTSDQALVSAGIKAKEMEQARTDVEAREKKTEQTLKTAEARIQKTEQALVTAEIRAQKAEQALAAAEQQSKDKPRVSAQTASTEITQAAAPLTSDSATGKPAQAAHQEKAASPTKTEETSRIEEAENTARLIKIKALNEEQARVNESRQKADQIRLAAEAANIAKVEEQIRIAKQSRLEAVVESYKVAQAQHAELARLPEETKAAPGEAPVSQIERSLNEWATAWSNKHIGKYLGAYVNTMGPDGMSHEEWQKERAIRISKPQIIEVKLSHIEITLQDNTHATARFTQDYRSDNYRDQVKKTLRLINMFDHWLIAAETVEKSE